MRMMSAASMAISAKSGESDGMHVSRMSASGLVKGGCIVMGLELQD